MKSDQKIAIIIIVIIATLFILFLGLRLSHYQQKISTVDTYTDIGLTPTAKQMFVLTYHKMNHQFLNGHKLIDIKANGQAKINQMTLYQRGQLYRNYNRQINQFELMHLVRKINEETRYMTDEDRGVWTTVHAQKYDRIIASLKRINHQLTTN